MRTNYTLLLVLVLWLSGPGRSSGQDGSMAGNCSKLHDRSPGHGAVGIGLRGGLLNDECDGAIDLVAADDCVPVEGSLAGATQSFAPSVCDGGTTAAAEDVWYVFTATATDHMVTVQAGSDVVLGVFTGACADLSLLQCRDQSGDQGFEQLFLEGLTVDGSYFIRIHAFDAGLPADPLFTVCVSRQPAGYCLGSSANTGYEVISTVSLGDNSNQSTDTIGYEDHTNLVWEVTPGESAVLVVEVANEYASDIVNGWIDLDRNQQFDESERILNSEGETPHGADVQIPADLALGEMRMRIRLQDSDYDAEVSPCFNTFYGQVEDYTLNVVTPQGMAEAQGAGWTIYPGVRTGDWMVVHPTGVVRSAVEVFDATGRAVYQERRNFPAGAPVLLQWSNGAVSGIFMIRISSDDGSFTQRVFQP